MLQLLVATCLTLADGGTGAELAEDPYETAEVDAGVDVSDAPVASPVEPLAPPPPPPVLDTEKRDSRPEFVKGELSVYLGSDRLTVKNPRIGVSAGIDRFEDAFYALIEPMI